MAWLAWTEDTDLRLLTESRSGEHWIRPNTGAIEGFAFLHRFGSYDEKAVGFSRAELLRDTLVPRMRYLVTTHITGARPTSDGKKWGDAWQSAHWTQMLGRGAWFVWADLPPDVRDGVSRVVAHEADRIARSEPPHQLRSDTKAEENAWNSQVLSVAMPLLPGDARRAGWEKAMMTRRPMPEALLFNVAPIYENLKWMLLPDGGFVYPNGQDWELFRNPSWLGKHVLMAVWAHDPDGWTWVLRELEVLEKMQARSTNGAVFHPGEYFFASTQHDLFRSLANAWLCLQLAGEIPNTPRERIGVRRWDSAKVILRRTTNAIHTVGWGSDYQVVVRCRQ